MKNYKVQVHDGTNKTFIKGKMDMPKSATTKYEQEHRVLDHVRENNSPDSYRDCGLTVSEIENEK